MAITNAQQFKQLVNPPMKGKTRPGYRGEAAAASAAASDRGMQGRSVGSDPQGRGDGPPTNDRGVYATRDPMSQFTPQAAAIAKEMRDATMGAGDRFVPDFFPITKGLANFFQVKKPTPFDIQRRGFIKALGPQAVDMSGMDRGGDVPYWAQLGFSSEAEYLASLRAQAPSDMEQEPEVEEPFQLSRRFRAEGGIMNADVVGGEFDFESARQMYGLGKLVKKVTKTVKKIAKSPVGKAALLYAGTAGLGSFGRTGKIFSSGMFKPTNIMSGLFGLPGGSKLVDPTPGIFGKLGLTKGGGSLMPTALGGIAAASALAGLLTPEQEEEAQDLARGEGIDIEEARRSILNAGTAQDFRARRFRAEGGSMKEPVAKKTMPLLDMGGKEMDLREEGGFVPIGRMEKADDVPARLSKNEFVFTADAVRNAGDGDVDKGAEVMYNMMKNLESGGDVSEESQGLEGARRMFQTSQRLEEVL